ncbi:unnamed protein product [Closterium sp. Naga37s-1]|nr:unnamed protein product [Closterium sp. Naga37s-1]
MVEQDSRAERTREESDEEDEQEDGDEPAYDDRQRYDGGRAHDDEPEYGDEQGRKDGQEYDGEQKRGDEPEYGGKKEHGDEPEYGGEREHGDEQEDSDPQQEGNDLAPVGPHVPSGAVEGERAPGAEHANNAAAAEEEEGEARERGARATDFERLERRYAPDPLQQETHDRNSASASGDEGRKLALAPRIAAEGRSARQESGEEWKRMWFARRRHRGHLKEAVGEDIARQRRSGTGRGDEKKDHAHRTSGNSGGQGTEGCRGRPTGAVGEKEGGKKQTAPSPAHGSRERAGRNGRHHQRDVIRVKPTTRNGSRAIIRRRGDGSGRAGKRVCGASQGRRAESSWKAGPSQAAWRKGRNEHEWPEKA